MSFIGRALGKLAPQLDPRTLRLASYLQPRDVPAPPPRRDWAEALPLNLESYRNHEIGDCTVAAAAHHMQTWTAQHGVERVATERDVLEAYRAVSGYDGRPETDRGADMLTVLKHWRRTGVGGHKVRAFVKLDHDDELQVRIAINLFGGVYTGAMLPRAAQDLRTIWDVPQARLIGDHAPGSWGGHAMACVGYSRIGPCFLTWGRRKWATWQWWQAYVDEAYAVISDDWVADGKVAPNGFDLDALNSDLREIV